jgi:hypothetical protein
MNYVIEKNKVVEEYLENNENLNQFKSREFN